MNPLELMKIKDVVKKHKDLLDYIKKKKEELGGDLYGIDLHKTDTNSIILHIRDKVMVIIFDFKEKIEVIDGERKVFNISPIEQRILYIFISGELMREFLMMWVEK